MRIEPEYPYNNLDKANKSIINTKMSIKFLSKINLAFLILAENNKSEEFLRKDGRKPNELREISKSIDLRVHK